MVSYIATTHSPSSPPSSPRHVSFMPIPIYSRKPRDDELFVMRAYERHAGRCTHCADPLRTHRAGSTLCAKGHAYAIDVAQYVYHKDGAAYSLVDRRERQRVRLELPADMVALDRLLRAWGEGLELLQPVTKSSRSSKESASREAAAPAKSSEKKVRPVVVERKSSTSNYHRRSGSSSSSNSDRDYVYASTYTYPEKYTYAAAPPSPTTYYQRVFDEEVYPARRAHEPRAPAYGLSPSGRLVHLG